MKRVFLALLMVLCFATVAICEELVIEKKINQIVFKLDKSGNQYARIIVSEKKELNGIAYMKDTSCMVFGAENVADVKKLKKGDTFKAIVAENTFRGSTGYQLLKLVPKDAK